MNFRKIKKMLSIYLESELNYNKKKLSLETYLKNQEYKYDSDYISNEEWQETSFSIYKNNYIYNLVFPNNFFNYCIINIKDSLDNQINITLPYNNRDKHIFFKIDIKKEMKTNNNDENNSTFEINTTELKKYINNINIFLERIEIENMMTDKKIPDISVLLKDNYFLLEDITSFINVNIDKDDYNLIELLKNKKNLKIDKK